MPSLDQLIYDKAIQAVNKALIQGRQSVRDYLPHETGETAQAVEIVPAKRVGTSVEGQIIIKKPWAKALAYGISESAGQIHSAHKTWMVFENWRNGPERFRWRDGFFRFRKVRHVVPPSGLLNVKPELMDILREELKGMNTIFRARVRYD